MQMLWFFKVIIFFVRSLPKSKRVGYCLDAFSYICTLSVSQVKCNVHYVYHIFFQASIFNIWCMLMFTVSLRIAMPITIYHLIKLGYILHQWCCTLPNRIYMYKLAVLNKILGKNLWQCVRLHLDNQVISREFYCCAIASRTILSSFFFSWVPCQNPDKNPTASFFCQQNKPNRSSWKTSVNLPRLLSWLFVVDAALYAPPSAMKKLN
jgi:hypothetical protein